MKSIDYDASHLHDVRSVVAPIKGRLLVVILLGALAAVASLLQPLAVGRVVGAVEAGTATRTGVVVLIILFLGDAVFSALSGWMGSILGEDVVLGIRRTLVGRLLHATIPAHRGRSKGDVLARTVTDAALVKSAIVQSMTGIVVSSILVVGTIVIIAVLDLALFGVTIACLASAAIVAGLITLRVKGAATRQRADVGEFSGRLGAALDGLTTIKLTRAEPRESTRLTELAGAARGSGVRTATLGAMVSPVISVGLEIAFASVFVVGLGRVANGTMALATFTSFVLYLFYLVTPLVGAAMSIVALQRGVAALDRVGTLAGEPVEDDRLVDDDRAARSTAEPDAVRPPEAAPSDGDGSLLEVQDLTWTTPDGTTVLDGMSFTLPTRGVTALVGASGSGKSSLLELLVGFTEPTDGVVKVDGDDLAELGRSVLRRRVGLVEQHPHVRDASLAVNLRMARPDASAAAVDEVVSACDLERVVADAGGLDAPLGDGDVRLSGGERQRVALARILLAEPDLLLLDEVTSQLDATSEQALARSIETAGTQRGVLVVTHRMATLVRADRALVLDDGRIVDEGPVRDLLARPGFVRDVMANGGDESGTSAPEPDVPRRDRDLAGSTT